MASTVTVSKRPLTAILTAALLLFLGVTAVAGSIGMVSGVEAMAPPDAWLDDIPMVDSWVLPGLVLGIGFGIGSLIAAFGVLRRPRWPALNGIRRVTGHHWAWIATVLIGAGQALWISMELVYLPDPSVLQAVYLPVGLALLAFPFVPSMSRYLGADR